MTRSSLISGASIAFLAGLLVACSSSDDKTPPAGDSGASGNNNGADSSSGGGSGTDYTSGIACNYPKGTLAADKTDCQEVLHPTATAITQTQTACGAVHGALSVKCPTDSLVGCCNRFGAINCYYNDDPKASTEQTTCTGDSGTWTTSPP